MPAYLDSYVISERRNKATINTFLNHFLPIREASVEEYEFPQHSDKPQATYTSADEVIERCISNKHLKYGIYWQALNNAKSKEPKPAYAMVFFLEDGHVIYGLSSDEVYSEYAAELLQKLKVFIDSSDGYIAFEAPPDASNLQAFKEQVAAP